MAYDKVVDSAQLDADLTIVADAIRSKGGTTESLSFPQGMKQAVEAIQSGGGSEEFVGIKYSDFDSFRGSPRVADARSLPTKNTKNFGGYPYLFAKYPSKTANGGWTSLLEVVYLPDGLSELSIAMFQGCWALKKIIGDFSELKTIYGGCFNTCGITALLLNIERLVELQHTNAFANSAIEGGTGFIYVPKALIEEYKVATNWVTYANQFRALEDYTVDGTITGELDESKI